MLENRQLARSNPFYTADVLSRQGQAFPAISEIRNIMNEAGSRGDHVTLELGVLHLANHSQRCIKYEKPNYEAARLALVIASGVAPVLGQHHQSRLPMLWQQLACATVLAGDSARPTAQRVLQNMIEFLPPQGQCMPNSYSASLVAEWDRKGRKGPSHLGHTFDLLLKKSGRRDRLVSFARGVVGGFIGFAALFGVYHGAGLLANWSSMLVTAVVGAGVSSIAAGAAALMVGGYGLGKLALHKLIRPVEKKVVPATLRQNRLWPRRMGNVVGLTAASALTVTAVFYAATNIASQTKILLPTPNGRAEMPKLEPFSNDSRVSVPACKSSAPRC